MPRKLPFTDKNGNFTKFGENPSVGTVYEDIWTNGGQYLFLANAEQIDVASVGANAADDKGTPTAGTGARTIIIQGLDSDYNFIEEEVTMNGVTPVRTTASFLRIFRAFVQRVGSDGINQGDIKGTPAVTTAAIQFEIVTDIGQSQLSIFTVPAGYSLDIKTFETNTGKGDDAIAELMWRKYLSSPDEYGGWRIIIEERSYQNATNEPLDGTVLPEKSDVRVRAKSANGTSGIDVSYGARLVLGSI